MTFRTKSIAKPALLFLGCFGVYSLAASQSHYAYSVEDSGELLTSDDLDAIDPNLSQPKPETLMEGSHQSLPAKEMKIAKVQILLDRAGISPGSINGKQSDYLLRALGTYEAKFNISDLLDDSEKIGALLASSGGDAFVEYEITERDVTGPYLSYLPKKIKDQGDIKALSFLSVEEALAERFHMDETFLRRLNPKMDFKKVGAKIKVAYTGKPLNRWVGRIHADKELKQVTAYDEKGDVLAVYPASIGSLETPSPVGSFKVRNKAGNPFYTLSPDNNFETVDNARAIKVAPGPNNPVGVAWIGLSKKTYGIHGTPFPSSIGQAESHGCIRLTNWDALELATLVRTGIEVVID